MATYKFVQLVLETKRAVLIFIYLISLHIFFAKKQDIKNNK